MEPNVPFAMMGGGPRHLHRADVPGPKEMPTEIASFRTGARIAASPTIGEFLAQWEDRPPLLMLPIAMTCIATGAYLLSGCPSPDEVGAPLGVEGGERKG